MDIQPGQTVTITVTAKTIRPSAQKTLARLFLKDPAVSSQRLHDPKRVQEKRRGGRFWRHRPPGSAAVPPEHGESAKVTATLDVIRDIQSVERFVDVK